MKKIVTITLTLTLTLTLAWLGWVRAQAQDELYVYRHGAQQPDTVVLSEVKGISHSRVDLQGRRHDDFVLMDVTLADGSVRRFPLEALDSVVMQRGGERYRLVRFTGSMSDDGTLRSRRGLRRTSLNGDFSVSSEDGVHFFWEDGDNIYITVDNNGKDADSVVIREGKDVASFFFKNTTVSGDSIVVYYPGQTALAYNQLRVADTQTQALPNNSEHLGKAGDCGTGVATKNGNVNGNDNGNGNVNGNGNENGDGYEFVLDHKATYLCFLPYISNDLKRTVLKQITVRSDSAIAGVFTLDTLGIHPLRDTTHTVTLTTGNFVLPRTANQYDCSAYMVIAPQNGLTRLTCEFTVCDTVLQSTGVYTKTVDLAQVESNMVYVINANCNNYVVDLGLPVKFLNHNMGAFAPEEYGGYYAYGELTDKGTYSNDDYFTNKNTPYDEMANIRLTDRDVAHARLGGNFSMPTSAEFNMLVDSCTWIWQDSFNGMPGYKIIGKNGNALFMPAAGYYNGSNPYDVNARGLYRTSQLVSSGRNRNWFLNFRSNVNNKTDANRYSPAVITSGDDIYLGESIRPVVSAGLMMTDGTVIGLMTDSVQWMPAQSTATLFGTVNGISTAKTAVELGFVVGDNANITLTSTGATTVKAAATTADGMYFADFTMPKDTAYYFRAYAKDKDGNVDYGNVLQFGRTYVDLRLPSGTKWANINLGAARPDQDGDYYAYGEVTTKSSNTSENNLWYESSTWLFPDGLRDIQATRHDVISKTWGGVWMMPEKADMEELIANTTMTSAYMNGIKGFVFTSKYNDKSIFVPKAAWRDGGVASWGEYSYGDNYGLYTNRVWLATSDVRNNSNYEIWCIRDNEFIDWQRKDAIPHRAVWKTNATAANGSAMYVRTLPARKKYNGTEEADTLYGVIRGLETAGTGNTYGFKYWKHGDEAHTTTVELTPDADGYITTFLTQLQSRTTYHYAAYINNGTETFCGDTLDITTVGMVDLGLSVKWANVNLGAESEGAGGDFYRWGATVPYRKQSQQWGAAQNITPESGRDIATILWGMGYRMPTRDEYLELIENTTRKWVYHNGYLGFMFVSTVEGVNDSIFIPAAGYYVNDGSDHKDWNANADYWTSTVNGTGSAYDLNFANGALVSTDGSVPSHDKKYGFSVRAVQDKKDYVQTIGMSRYTKDGAEVDTLKLYYTHNSGKTVTVGFLLGQDAELTAGQTGVSELVITNPVNGFNRFVKNGLQKGVTYYYRAFVHPEGEAYIYGDVLELQLLDYVDLGLPSGNLWANVNLGAAYDEDFGDYYAWGETRPKSYYSESNYTWKQNNSWIQIGSDIAGTQYDAATVNLGELWQLPTLAECKELIDNTDRVLYTENGTNYWKFMKKDDHTKYIVLPSAGRWTDAAWGETDKGLYLPSTRHSDDHCHDFHLPTSGPEANPGNNHNSKWKGYSVRAIIHPTATTATTANQTVIRVKTLGDDLPFGATTATLRGLVAVSAPVQSMTYGFVVGGILDVDTSTPNLANCHEVSNMNADHIFSYEYTGYDGSAKYYRAYVMIGSTYYLGDIKSLSYADMLDVVLTKDSTAYDGTATNFAITRYGKPKISYSNTYKRYVANFDGNTFGVRGGCPNRYTYYFGYQSDYLNKMSDGYSIEAVYMRPKDATEQNSEGNVAATADPDGGSTIGVRNRQLFSAFRFDGNWVYVQSDVVPEKDVYYHVVTVYDKSQNKLIIYVDGVNHGEQPVGTTINLPTRDFKYNIGCEPNNDNGLGWDGTVVLARVYSDPLTADQVRTLYNNVTK